MVIEPGTPEPVPADSKGERKDKRKDKDEKPAPGKRVVRHG